MKRLLIWVVGIVVIALATGLGVVMTWTPKARATTDLKVDGGDEAVKRGRYLVEHVTGCFGCHQKHDWTKFAGPPVGPKGTGSDCWTEDMGIPGRVCPGNLTPDAETGVGRWSDDELLRALREGIAKDGSAIAPMMPWMDYRLLSDTDAHAIVAYLRTLTPVRNEVGTTDLKPPLKFIVKFLPEPLTGKVAEPAGRGEYLARVAGCKSCHTPVDKRHQPIPGMEFAGGQTFTAPFGKVSASNITPHESSSLPKTKDAFIAQFRRFSDPAKIATPVTDGVSTVMPWYEYAGMTDADLGALYDHLKAQPAVANAVTKYPK